MSVRSVAPPVMQPEPPLSVPLGSLKVMGPKGFTLTGAELSWLVSLAHQQRGFHALVDADAINMELRGLAVLVWTYGRRDGTHIDDEHVSYFIERALQDMAARLEAGDSSDYTVTIDRTAVA